MMKRLLTAGVLLLVAGCASTPMIRSVDRTQTDISFDPGSQATRASYLGDYPLPRSRFTVTLSAPPASSAPATAVSPTVNNTVTVNTATPATAAAAAKDPASDLPGWCRAQRDAYNQRKRTISTAAARLVALQHRYEADHGVPDDDDDDSYVVLSNAEKADWKDRLLAQIPLMIAADNALHENLSVEPAIQTNCPQPVRVTITETVERDPTRIFSLYADHDDAASDKLSIALDANGFITSLTGTTSDRSGEALVGATKTLAAVTTVVNPFDLSAAGAGLDGVVVKGSSCRTTGSAIARAERLRASLRQSNAITSRTVYCGLGLLKVADTTPEIDLTLPREFTYLVPTPAKAGDATAQLDMDFSDVSALNLKGEITCAIGRRSRTEDAVGEGLVWSTPTPCEITIERNDVEIARANTWSLDSSRTTLLEVPRTPLITQTSGYAFVNGRQTGVNWERPSPTEQFVTLPVRMIGAVVEGISAGASGQRGRTEAQTAQIEAETARLEALTALEAARAARSGNDEEVDE